MYLTPLKKEQTRSAWGITSIRIPETLTVYRELRLIFYLYQIYNTQDVLSQLQILANKAA